MMKESEASLQTRPKSGRPSRLPLEISVMIQKKMKESKQGWTTRQAYEMSAKESGVEYHQKYIYQLLRR
jgi:transposase